MIHDKDRWIAAFDFLTQSRLLLENTFESSIVVFNVSDGLREASLDVVVVFVFEDPCL